MASYRVCLSEPAENDLRDTANYIATQYSAPMTASGFVKGIKKEINDKLGFWPGKYRLVNNAVLASFGLRYVIVKKRVVFFVVHEKENIVLVVRIIYGRRDMARILSEMANIVVPNSL